MENPTNKEIESKLKELLDELLEYGNQEGSIISINYNKETETCTVEMNVVLTQEPEFINITFTPY